MAKIRSQVTFLAAGIALFGCVPPDGAKWSASGSPETQAQFVAAAEAQTAPPLADANSPAAGGSAKKTAAAPPDGAAAPEPPPQLGHEPIKTASVTTASPTGTFVGKKIAQLRIELERLKVSVKQQTQRLNVIRKQGAENSRHYYSAVAAINSRLQVGTTPGNPVLVNQWNSAQSRLAKIDNDIAQLNGLATGVTAMSTMSSYLLETTRAAYGLTGAVDEDHRQLAQVEDDVNRTVVQIERLLNQLSEDINRQINYVSNERSNLTTLSLAIKNGELLGTNLQNRARLAAVRASVRVAAAPRTPVKSSPLPTSKKQKTASTKKPTKKAPKAKGTKRRPLVVIRFDRPNVTFEHSLYNAVSSAIERRPSATFDLVAVAPKSGTAAQVAVASSRSKRDAETVLRSLSEMGLPLDRVRLSAKTSTGARTNEVHVYVR